MKTYGNGPKGMRYGGMSRKPMMYGGKATMKPKKKKQMGGMINNTMSTGMNKMPNPMMGKSMMAMGGKLPMTTVKGKKVPVFAADGKGKNDLA
jgi:hypothetical protein